MVLVRGLVVVFVPAVLAAQETYVSENFPLVRAGAGEPSLWLDAQEKVRALKEGLQVNPRDRIGTPDGRYGLIHTEGDSLIGLLGIRPSEREGLAVERADKGLRVKLYRGQVVVETFAAPIAVETVSGTIEAKQAYFFVEAGPKSTRVIALDGTLNFTNSLGSITLSPENEGVATLKSPPAPSAAKPADVALALQPFRAAEAAHNLLKNPSFEDGLKGWSPSSRETQISFETQGPHSGSRCVRLEESGTNTRGQDDLWMLRIFQEVNTTPGRRYLVRGYQRTERKTGIKAIRLSVTGSTGAEGVPCAVSAENVWKMSRGVFTAKEAKMRVYVSAWVDKDAPQGRYDGAVCWDDIALVELPALQSP